MSNFVRHGTGEQYVIGHASRHCVELEAFINNFDVHSETRVRICEAQRAGIRGKGQALHKSHNEARAFPGAGSACGGV